MSRLQRHNGLTHWDIMSRVHVSKLCRHCGAETGLIRRNWTNAMTADALDPCVRFGEGFQLPTSHPWWRHQIENFPRFWPFVRWIHRSPVNSPHKGQWRGVLMFSLICAWTNVWVNSRDAGDLGRHRAHDDVALMCFEKWSKIQVYVYVY